MLDTNIVGADYEVNDKKVGEVVGKSKDGPYTILKIKIIKDERD